MSAIHVGTVCQDCAALVADDDDGGMDPSRADLARASVAAIRADESGAPLIEARSGGIELFRCGLCGDDVMSYAYDLIIDGG